MYWILLQLIYLLGDSISDWDCIIDSFEKLMYYRKEKVLSLVDLSLQSSIKNLLLTLDKFKFFTVYLSNESLLKLTTSLVASSMNDIVIFSQMNFEGSNEKNALDALEIIKDISNYDFLNPNKTIYDQLLDSGKVSFSLYLVIEITKQNIFRVSAVWQMVTSHLRMMGLGKVSF